MQHSESIKEIATALAKAQAAMHGATKDRKNPAFKSDYATLSSVVEAARGPLTDNGICFVQSPGAMEDGGISVTTTLVHTSGEWFKSTVTMPVKDRSNAQAVGSAITYGCRYSLMAMLGLPPVDDDGNAASAGKSNVNGNYAPARPAAPPEPTAAEKATADEIEAAFDGAETNDALEAIRKELTPDIDGLPEALKLRLRRVYGLKRKVLETFSEAAE
jgi:hypothetical protein